jgi:hypothetical protein
MKSFKYYHPKYKITWGDIMADCPTEAFPLRFLVRGILMSVIWTLLPLAIGAAHFRKTDIG